MIYVNAVIRHLTNYQIPAHKIEQEIDQEYHFREP